MFWKLPLLFYNFAAFLLFPGFCFRNGLVRNDRSFSSFSLVVSKFKLFCNLLYPLILIISFYSALFYFVLHFYTVGFFFVSVGLCFFSISSKCSSNSSKWSAFFLLFALVCFLLFLSFVLFLQLMVYVFVIIIAFLLP